MARKELSEGMPSFAMVPVGGDSSLLAAVRAGHIRSSDLAVFHAVLDATEWTTGRCWSSIHELGASAVRNYNATQQALGRLRKARLVAKGADRRCPRRVFWCVSPLAAAFGGPKRRDRLWVQWMDAAG
jgi:hypothetical protein